MGRIVSLAIVALLAGCGARGHVPGLGLEAGWPVVHDVMTRRGEPTLEEAPRKIRIVHSRHYPNDLLVDDQVGPRYAESFGGTKDYVEVSLSERSGGIAVVVEAWRETRAFARQVERERSPELADDVLAHVMADLRHRRDRERALARLAAQRAAASVELPEGMVLIPATRFVFGDDDGHADEGPAREVALSSYLIDRHEVTVAEYRRFMEAGGYRQRRFWSEAGWRWKLMFGISAPKAWRKDLRDTLPVIGVSWYEADAYARWAGKQLPTEAQWECAARYTVASRYPWGNTWITAVNCLVRPRYGPCPVSEHPEGASIAGCLNMAGNAAEWCRDWYAEEAIRSGPDRDPPGPEVGRYRVLRGGSFFSPPDEVRACYRDRAEPGERAVSYGFRCVMRPQPGEGE